MIGDIYASLKNTFLNKIVNHWLKDNYLPLKKATQLYIKKNRENYDDLYIRNHVHRPVETREGREGGLGAASPLLQIFSKVDLLPIGNYSEIVQCYRYDFVFVSIYWKRLGQSKYIHWVSFHQKQPAEVLYDKRCS